MPAPPYFSSAHISSRPCSPAFRKASRSTMPCSCQRSAWGWISFFRKARTESLNISCSSSNSFLSMTSTSLMPSARSAALEFRFPFLEEGGDPLRVVVAQDECVLQARLHVERAAPATGHGVAHGPLRGGDGQGRPLRQRRRPCGRSLAELVGRHHLVHQPPFQALVRRYALGLHAGPEGPLVADLLRQQPGGPAIGHQGDAGEGRQQES